MSPLVPSLIALAAVAFAVVMIARRHKSALSSEPAGWSAGPPGYSSFIPIGSDGSFDFPTSAPGVHYITKACGPLAKAKGIRLRYRIDADPGVRFDPTSDPSAPSIGPTLYFQRGGDDWSGKNEYETYRWWATFKTAVHCPMIPGEYEVIASFSEEWTAVETSNAKTNPQAFKEALAKAVRVGFTFGGGTGYGHGVYATGKARFTLIELTVS